MPIEQQQEHGIPVLAPVGRLDTNTAPEFEATLLATLSEIERVIVDFSQLEYISSAGLRVVLMGAKRARQAGGALVLCGLAPNIRDIFAVSGFLKLLDTAETREQATDRLNRSVA